VAVPHAEWNLPLGAPAHESWASWGFVLGLSVPIAGAGLCTVLWQSNLRLRNGLELNDKLVDEAFFAYDFASDGVAWSQGVLLLAGYFWQLGFLHSFLSGVLSFVISFSSFYIRRWFRWRWNLPPLPGESAFAAETGAAQFRLGLSRVCEAITTQPSHFWDRNMNACISIFGTYEYNYVQQVQKAALFTITLLLISSMLHKSVIGPVFENTRAGWPYFVIYGALAMAMFAVYGSTPTDVMPSWSSQGNEEFGLELSRAEGTLF